MMRKILYLGWGAVSLSREKTEKYIAGMVDKGRLSSEEAERYVNELVKKGEEERKEIQNLVRKEIDEIKKDFSFARRSDLDALEKRVLELEKTVKII